MNHLKEILISRLKNKGMELGMIPGFMRSLSNSLFMNANMNLFQVKAQLRYKGWDDFDLDYCTFQLAVECLEASGLTGLEYRPDAWFENKFISN
ncbi:hypothetical protein ACFL9U_05445 [Thermodesulfobacteriota bacterium]